jgi:hypothetical protein
VHGSTDTEEFLMIYFNLELISYSEQQRYLILSDERGAMQDRSPDAIPITSLIVPW